MKKLTALIFIALATFFARYSLAENVAIIAVPEKIMQGEPLMIRVEVAGGISDVSKILFNGKSLWFFTYNDKPSALFPIDLNQKPGEYKITIKLANGDTIEKIVTVTAREKIEKPLGIPQKLGGNTPEAATSLVTNLAKENAVINGVKSALKRFWSEKFIYPVAIPIVTDNYGYLRKTGYYTIPHKGADFRAAEKTPVFAMNRGIARLVTKSTIYGKTIAVDHGFGVITYYMHLSKIYVTQGELVKRGQTIGLSGMTGYAEVPHLHLSVKINGTSIDPVKFLDIFK